VPWGQGTHLTWKILVPYIQTILCPYSSIGKEPGDVGHTSGVEAAIMLSTYITEVQGSILGCDTGYTDAISHIIPQSL
jgi:hypothetical protein